MQFYPLKFQVFNLSLQRIGVNVDAIYWIKVAQSPLNHHLGNERAIITHVEECAIRRRLLAKCVMACGEPRGVGDGLRLFCLDVFRCFVKGNIATIYV